MARIENDKYYTKKVELEEQAIITKEALKNEKISLIIDPCAGLGLIKEYNDKYFPNIPSEYYDLEPEADFIKKQDVRTLKKDKVIEKVDGTLFMSNAPFEIMGSVYANIKPFADFISLISYGSNYNFTPVALRAEFELLKSVDLGNRTYSGVQVTTCLNIYNRKTKKTKVELYPKKMDDYIGTRTIQKRKDKQKWNGYDLDLEKHDGKYQFFIQSRGTVGKVVKYKEDLNRCGYIAIEVKDKKIYDYFNSQAYQDFVDRTNNSTKNLTVKSATMSSTALKCDIAEWLRINSTYQEGRHVATTTDSIAKVNINDYAKLKFIKRTNIEKYKKWKNYREDLNANHYDYFIISHGNVGRIISSKEELTHCEYIGVEIKNKLIKDYFKSQAYRDYINRVKNPTGTKVLGNVSLRITDLKESMSNWITTNMTICDETYDTDVTGVIPEFENTDTTNPTETSMDKDDSTQVTIENLWGDLMRNEGFIKVIQLISDIQINILKKDSYNDFRSCSNLDENVSLNAPVADFRNCEIVNCDAKGNYKSDRDGQIFNELNIISLKQVLYYNDYDTM
jgi:hypothetical protein